jgi:hypothetical protein
MAKRGLHVPLWKGLLSALVLSQVVNLLQVSAQAPVSADPNTGGQVAEETDPNANRQRRRRDEPPAPAADEVVPTPPNPTPADAPTGAPPPPPNSFGAPQNLDPNAQPAAPPQSAPTAPAAPRGSNVQVYNQTAVYANPTDLGSNAFVPRPLKAVCTKGNDPVNNQVLVRGPSQNSSTFVLS